MAKPTAAVANNTPDTETRARQFMRSALDILGETGRTDFTVVEVVDRSKTSLRAFYQHFATKDDLVLALIDAMLSDFVTTWQIEAAQLHPTDALRALVDLICGPAATAKQESINRGLTYYHDRLADIMAVDYGRVLKPLHALIADIIERGVAIGTFHPDLEIEPTAALVMQTIFGAIRLRALGPGLDVTSIGNDRIYAFCLRAVVC
ncbi:TetR/AcrR family transcriptional regulator [Mycobacterium sp. CBMA293]|uniref:TetR/AcrR family transcriptional regulator n=1 Tax=unclassified Mycolicibacterium TaxID=2636767 RepID=UPI0012DBD444|nr:MULTISPECIES: TetR/AcrR family transcriptional regulator [unclassified Mycolicibacterium]MUL47982.1 TetR/AcrR family transcriptional regulator [Mycolicibacterium sp. CBMA 360]MUL58160.1 TetR/AcrR family transcriptional regulator [Mycolicibacterium sp. CBMA 335]MUL73618.1 TetR/AcrR family transcriptional regulator [Mycolicibacterium sp. CBMA 311]MUL93043.1 TetR/AcrR family transcriptional regulator [Mycolicibacterium sp. CBMA 230]MUM07592.1 TetR family transcriptional regulator [Mycolicibact